MRTLIASTPLVSNVSSLVLAGEIDSATALTFGAGVAVGAVLGGLVVGLAGRRAKRRMQEEIDEVVQTAERAEEAARRAEALLSQHEATQQEPDASAQETANMQRDRLQKRLETETVQAEKPATSRGRGVRSLLQERLGNNVFDDIPVIDRGQERPADVTQVVVTHRRPAVREFDPELRAALIDRRVPRFDESLFPDTSVLVHDTEPDMFEKAMRAMDDTLGDLVSEEAQPASADVTQAAPDSADTGAYIEYLVQDEMERNRSGAGRRFSRSQLTMFEGTGELGAAKRKLRYRPRHMQQASREA